MTDFNSHDPIPFSRFLPLRTVTVLVSWQHEVHETRAYPSLSSWTRCRVAKKEVENSVEEKLSWTRYLFLFINPKTKRLSRATTTDIFLFEPSSRNLNPLVSFIHLRETKRDSIHRGEGVYAAFLSRMDPYKKAPLLKTALKNVNTRARWLNRRPSNTQHWNPWQWPRASRFYRTVYNHEIL